MSYILKATLSSSCPASLTKLTFRNRFFSEFPFTDHPQELVLISHRIFIVLSTSATNFHACNFCLWSHSAKIIHKKKYQKEEFFNVLWNSCLCLCASKLREVKKKWIQQVKPGRNSRERRRAAWIPSWQLLLVINAARKFAMWRKGWISSVGTWEGPSDRQTEMLFKLRIYSSNFGKTCRFENKYLPFIWQIPQFIFLLSCLKTYLSVNDILILL